MVYISSLADSTLFLLININPLLSLSQPFPPASDRSLHRIFSPSRSDNLTTLSPVVMQNATQSYDGTRSTAVMALNN